MASLTHSDDTQLLDTTVIDNTGVAVLKFKTALINCIQHKTKRYRTELDKACSKLQLDENLKAIIQQTFTDFWILDTDLTYLRLLMNINQINGSKHTSVALSILVDDLNLLYRNNRVDLDWYDLMQDYYTMLAQTNQIKCDGWYLTNHGQEQAGHDAMVIATVLDKGITAFGASMHHNSLDYQPLSIAHDKAKQVMRHSSLKAVCNITQAILNLLDLIDKVIAVKAPILSSFPGLIEVDARHNVSKTLNKISDHKIKPIGSS